jgi:hypothetical protein
MLKGKRLHGKWEDGFISRHPKKAWASWVSLCEPPPFAESSTLETHARLLFVSLVASCVCCERPCLWNAPGTTSPVRRSSSSGSPTAAPVGTKTRYGASKRLWSCVCSAPTRLRSTVCSKDARFKRSDASTASESCLPYPPLSTTPSRCTLPASQVPLLIDKKAVVSGLCSQSEYQEILELLISVSDSLEARGRTRCAALVPVVHIRALCMKLGRGPRTTALVTALNQPIELWDRMEEQERNLAENCVDLALEESTPGTPVGVWALHALTLARLPPSQRLRSSRRSSSILGQSCRVRSSRLRWTRRRTTLHRRAGSCLASPRDSRQSLRLT